MKITCTKCGKRFDAENHMYICPKCNHYHSQTGAHGRSRETVSAASMTDKKSRQVDSLKLEKKSANLFGEKTNNPLKSAKKSLDLFGAGSQAKDMFNASKKENLLSDDLKGKLKNKLESVNVMDVLEDIIIGDETTDNTPDNETEFIQTLNGDQRVYTARKKPEEESRDAFGNSGSIGKKISLGICIIIGFVMLISNMIGGFEGKGDSSFWEDDWGSSSVEEFEVNFGDPMNFETFTVNVEGICEPEFDGLKADNGYKFVQINFNTESSYKYESGDIWTDVYLDYSDESNWDYTYYALYEDEVTNDKSLEKELRNAGLVIEAHYSGEYFCIFEIPEEAEDVVLKVKSYVPAEEDSWEYVEHECFCMPIQL